MFLPEFVKVIMPLNLPLDQVEPILQVLICKPMAYYHATKNTIYQDQWPRFVKTGSDWVKLIRKYGTRASDVCNWDTLLYTDWSNLLRYCPQFADKCTCWHRFGGWDWVYLCRYQPIFAEKCDWTKVTERQWLVMVHEMDILLQYYPKYIAVRQQNEQYSLTHMSKYHKMLLLKQRKLEQEDRNVEVLSAREAIYKLSLEEHEKRNRPEVRQLNI